MSTLKKLKSFPFDFDFLNFKIPKQKQRNICKMFSFKTYETLSLKFSLDSEAICKR